MDATLATLLVDFLEGKENSGEFLSDHLKHDYNIDISLPKQLLMQTQNGIIKIFCHEDEIDGTSIKSKDDLAAIYLNDVVNNKEWLEMYRFYRRDLLACGFKDDVYETPWELGFTYQDYLNYPELFIEILKPICTKFDDWLERKINNNK